MDLLMVLMTKSALEKKLRSHCFQNPIIQCNIIIYICCWLSTKNVNELLDTGTACAVMKHLI